MGRPPAGFCFSGVMASTDTDARAVLSQILTKHLQRSRGARACSGLIAARQLTLAAIVVTSRCCRQKREWSCERCTRAAPERRAASTRLASHDHRVGLADDQRSAVQHNVATHTQADVALATAAQEQATTARAHACMQAQRQEKKLCYSARATSLTRPRALGRYCCCQYIHEDDRLSCAGTSGATRPSSRRSCSRRPWSRPCRPPSRRR